jgi:predicted DNA binding protein
VKWGDLDKDTRELVERVLTPKQLEAVKLLNAGYGVRTIATALGLDKSTVKDRLAAAERKILKELDKREGARNAGQ